jgi:folate-binding protein YgfZ
MSIDLVQEPDQTTAAGTWRVAGGARPARPVVAALNSLGVIAIEGADAIGFLHGQLTNDVSHLDPQRVQLNGYCSAKGRLYAVFDNWRDADAVYLQLPREILPGVIRRLSMFVLRAKAKLRDASGEWRARAILGPGSAEELKAIAPAVPAVGATVCLPDGARLHRLQPALQVEERFLLLQPMPSSDAIKAGLPAATVPEGVFWWTQIDAGIPNVFAATQEKFVPQMINFEVLGGVNFRKGCYPGQEVVARSQYIGKLKRRMQRAHAAQGDVPLAADVYRSAEEQPLGTVVLAAPSPRGGTDLLFEAPIDRLASATLHVGAPAGEPLELRGLPYELFDPTA